MTLNALFQKDVRYVIPTFSRPYVWNQNLFKPHSTVSSLLVCSCRLNPLCDIAAEGPGRSSCDGLSVEQCRRKAPVARI